MVKKIKENKKPNRQKKNTINLSFLKFELSKKLKTKKKFSSSQNEQKFFLNKNILDLLNKSNDIETQFSKKYFLYIKEEFNLKIVSMIENYINTENPTCPKQFKTNDSRNKFLLIIKNLLMNEFEVAAFTLFLENILTNNNNSNKYILDQDESLLFFFLYSKSKISNEENFSLLQKLFKMKYPSEITEKYKKWEENLNNNKMGLNLNEINKRYRELIIQKNSCSKKKIIDYNELTKKIIEMTSSSAEEESKNNKIENNPLIKESEDFRSGYKSNPRIPNSNFFNPGINPILNNPMIPNQPFEYRIQDNGMMMMCNNNNINFNSNIGENLGFELQPKKSSLFHLNINPSLFRDNTYDFENENK